MKFFQWVIGIIFVLFVIGSILPDFEKQDTGQVGNKWYQGGTLHASTIKEWNVASSQNQLATAADWTTSVIGQKEFERIGLDGVRGKAEELVKCIKGSTNGLKDVEILSTKEIGAACIVLMKW